MSSKLGNAFLLQLLKKEIDFDSDTFKIILMEPGFAFNRATHKEYADVAGSELGTQYGYVAGGSALAGIVVSQDDVLNAGKVVWNNMVWTADGGALLASGAIIYDSTTPTKHIVGYIDFGGAQSTSSGGTCTIVTPTIAIAGT